MTEQLLSASSVSERVARRAACAGAHLAHAEACNPSKMFLVSCRNLFLFLFFFWASNSTNMCTTHAADKKANAGAEGRRVGTRRQVLQAGVQQDFQRGLRDVVAGECVLQVQPVVLGVLRGWTHEHCQHDWVHTP